MKLKREQQNKLIEWAADGMRLPEINELAAKFDPPFAVEWGQLKNVRRQYRTRYAELKEQFEKEAIGEGLSRKASRLRQLEELYDKHLELIRARAKEMADEVRGGETGLMSREYKGKEPVYKYDARLIREMRGILDDIARELGERRIQTEVSGPGGGAIHISISDLINKVYGGGTDSSGE